VPGNMRDEYSLDENQNRVKSETGGSYAMAKNSKQV
jgi:hypothetical protein